MESGSMKGKGDKGGKLKFQIACSESIPQQRQPRGEARHGRPSQGNDLSGSSMSGCITVVLLRQNWCFDTEIGSVRRRRGMRGHRKERKKERNANIRS